MSEEKKTIGERTEKAMTPSGKVSKYLANITPQEHLNLTDANTDAFILKEYKKCMDENRPADFEGSMVDALAFWVDDYNSRTPSRGGFLTKVLAKISGAVKSGTTIQQEEERSWLDRRLGKNKDVLK